MKDQPNINLSNLEKRDVFSISTALLYSLKSSPKYSMMSELFYILDYENFMKLIKYYGGQEIRIPTSQEINETLKILLVYQYYKIDNLDWIDSIVKAGFSSNESGSVKCKLQKLEAILNTQRLGRDYV